MEIENSFEQQSSTQPTSLQKKKKKRLVKRKDLISMDSDHTKEENNVTLQNQSNPQISGKQSQEKDNKSNTNSEKGENWEDKLLQEYYGLNGPEKKENKEKTRKNKTKVEKKRTKKNQKENHLEQKQSAKKEQLKTKKQKMKEMLSQLIDANPEEQTEEQPVQVQEESQQQEVKQQTSQKSTPAKTQPKQQKKQSSAKKKQKPKVKEITSAAKSNDDWLSRLKADPVFAQQSSDGEDDNNLSQMPLSSNMQTLKRKKKEADNIIKTRNKFFKEIKYSKEDALWDVSETQLFEDFAPGELELKQSQKTIWDGIKLPQTKKSFSQVFDRIKEWKRDRAMLDENQQQLQPQESVEPIKKTAQEMKEFLNRSCSLLKNHGKDECDEEVKLEIELPKMGNDKVLGNTLFINKMSRTQSVIKNFEGIIQPQPKQMKSSDIKEQLKESIKLRKSRHLTMEEVKKRFLITSLDDWEPGKKKEEAGGEQEEGKQDEKQNKVDENKGKEENPEDKKIEEKSMNEDELSFSINENNNENKQLDIEKIIELEEENEEESGIEDDEGENEADDEDREEEEEEEEQEQEEEQKQEQDQEQEQQKNEEEQKEEDKNAEINNKNKIKEDELLKESQQINEEVQDEKQTKLKKLRTVAQKLIDKLEEQKQQKEKLREEQRKKREQQERLARNPKTKEALRKMLELEAELGSDHEDHDDNVKQINRDDGSEHDSNLDDQESNNGLIDDLPQNQENDQAVWEKFHSDVMEQEKQIMEQVLKNSFRGQKRQDDLIDVYDNEFTKRKLQMVQERIKELQDKDNDNPLDNDNLEKQNENEASLFSDDEQDEERQHLLQIEMELKRKILTEHPIQIDESDFVDPEIMKRVVYVNQSQERDTFNKLLTPRKGTNSEQLHNSNSNSMRFARQQQQQQQQKPLWQQQKTQQSIWSQQQQQLQKQIFSSQNFNRNSVLALRMDKRQISRFNTSLNNDNQIDKEEKAKPAEETQELPQEQPKLQKSQNSILNKLFVSGTPNKVPQIQHMLRKTPMKSCFTRVTNKNDNTYGVRPRTIFNKQY